MNQVRSVDINVDTDADRLLSLMEIIKSYVWKNKIYLNNWPEILWNEVL